jgi:hypothetical protein
MPGSKADFLTATVPYEAKADYHVCATDVVTACKVTKGLPKLGVVNDLRGSTDVVRDGAAEVLRDPLKISELGTLRTDRLQTMAGIQFFFTQQFCSTRASSITATPRGLSLPSTRSSSGPGGRASTRTATCRC